MDEKDVYSVSDTDACRKKKSECSQQESYNPMPDVYHSVTGDSATKQR